MSLIKDAPIRVYHITTATVRFRFCLPDTLCGREEVISSSGLSRFFEAYRFTWKALAQKHFVGLVLVVRQGKPKYLSYLFELVIFGLCPFITSQLHVRRIWCIIL